MAARNSGDAEDAEHLAEQSKCQKVRLAGLPWFGR